jgi:hypothetical protein
MNDRGFIDPLAWRAQKVASGGEDPGESRGLKAERPFAATDDHINRAMNGRNVLPSGGGLTG